jgi:putative serine protease PepD
MTDESRGPGHDSFDDEERQAQQAPVDGTDEPETGSGFTAPDTIMDRPLERPAQQPPGDRLVAGPGGQPGPEAGRGYDFVPGFEEGPREQGPREQGYPGGQQGGYQGGPGSGGYGAQQPPPPGYGNRPPRPGFAPHDQDPRPPYGWQNPQYQPGPPAAGHQPPPQFAGQPPNQPPNWAPAPAPPTPGRGKPSTGLFVLMAVLVALVAGVVGGGIGVIASGKDGGNTGTVDLGGGKNSSSETKSRPANSVAGVAQKVLPSVVKIQVSLGNGEGGTGTGFLVKDGYILTNNHVVSEVKQGAQMQIVFNDKNLKATTGTIVGTDPTSDIAVVKPATTNGLPGLELGDSDAIAVGDEVIAIGSPLGLQGSVTTGIVSALNRPVQTSSESGTGDSSVLNAIQTDAAINPGNSGGPLLNASGQVIGINTAIASLSQGNLGGQQESGSIGLGFAIPGNQVKRVSESIINSGGKTPQHAIIGIVIDQTYTGTGVRIATSGGGGQAPVTAGGPAEKAGLRAGDIITAFDGKAIAQPQDLLAAIRSRAPGDKVNITYQRGGQPTTASITLGASS